MEFSYLDPQRTIFENAPDGTLRAIVPDEKCALQVEAFRAFPLSHPEEQIVLRDGGGVELGILQNLRDVPEPAQSRLRQQLRRRYFLPRITAIHDISERFGSSVWIIETDRGPRTISTKQLNEAIFEIEPNRFLVTDVEENRYEIQDLNALDASSRARFFGKN